MTNTQNHQNLIREVQKLCDILNSNGIKYRNRYINTKGEYAYNQFDWSVDKENPEATFGGGICNNANSKTAFKYLKETGAIDIGICWNCGEAPIKNEFIFSSGSIQYFICESCYSGGRKFQKQVLGYTKGKDKSNPNCYIASLCYGNIDAPEVQELRDYRDRILTQTFHGRLLIKLYYTLAPSLAKALKKYPAFNLTIRNRILDKLLRYIQSQKSKV